MTMKEGYCQTLLRSLKNFFPGNSTSYICVVLEKMYPPPMDSFLASSLFPAPLEKIPLEIPSLLYNVMWGCLRSWLPVYVMSFCWTELNRAEIIHRLINIIQWDQMGFLQIHINFFLESYVSKWQEEKKYFTITALCIFF